MMLYNPNVDLANQMTGNLTERKKKDGQGESSIAPTFSNGAVMKAFVIIFTSKDVVINQEAV